jgi:hypothetical protein
MKRRKDIMVGRDRNHDFEKRKKVKNILTFTKGGSQWRQQPAGHPQERLDGGRGTNVVITYIINFLLFMSNVSPS